MIPTRRKYLFVELNAVSKCKGENFRFCMCDPYDVFSMLLKKYNLKENKLVAHSKTDKKRLKESQNFFNLFK